MKFKNPLLVVTDMEKSKKFYKDVLGLRVIADFGANVTLTGGLCLQSKESWQEFIGKEKEIVLRSNSCEVYFEEEEFEKFIKHLEKIADVQYVHLPKCHSWGQNVVRIYDPDGHIIEIGENLKTVCKRFANQGMSEAEIAERMDVPLKMVQAYLEK